MHSLKPCLFVDGTNFYAGQYELFGPKRYLNFTQFIKEVQKQIKASFDKIYFYASYTPRTRKRKKFLKNEFTFYKQVKLTPKLKFFKGYRSKTSGKEKEVDVKLSVDLVGLGLLEKYDQAYILSGDADFLQAVFFVKKHCPEIKINLLCLANKIMYKGLYVLPSMIIDFKDKPVVTNKTIKKRNKFIYLKETAELCPRLG